MIGEGIVIKTCGSTAIVRIEKKSACSGDCSSCGLCANPVYDTEAINDADASVGDKVKLYMPAKKLYAAALLVYMLPVIAVFAVMGLCSVFGAPAAVTGVLCVCALFGWVCIIKLYGKKADLKSRATEVIRPNGENVNESK